MIYTAKIPETDSAITGACAQFASEITPVLPVEGMAIVLLDPDGETSRVVYSWANPAISWPSLAESIGVASTLPHTVCPSLRIPLIGQEGHLGEVLVRGWGPGVHISSSGALVEQCANHLALALENIRWRHRLDSKQQVNGAVQRMTQAAAPGVPINRVFRHLAYEIKAMAAFQRLSVYSVSQESDLATCVYRTGQGSGRRRSGESAKLSNSGLGETAASGESRIFSDISEFGCPVVWNQIMPSEMRSALLMPVVHHGATVGVVLLEHRLPRAYGAVNHACVEEVVAAISPTMGRLKSPNQPTADPGEPTQYGFQQQSAGISDGSQLLEEIFPPFVTSLANVVPFDRAGISWIDPNGYDLRNHWTSPGRGILEPESIPPADTSIDGRLYFKDQTIGVLTICRDRGNGFTNHEQTTLDQMGIQISPMVQANRLYVHARRQAFQLQQLGKEEMSLGPAGSLTSLTEALADQTAGIGQAEWWAAFLFDRRSLGQSSIADAVIHREELPADLLEEIAELAAKGCDEGAPVRRDLPRRLENAAAVPYSAKGHPSGFSREESWKCLALPLQNAVETTGVLVLGRSEGLPWTQEEIDLLEAFVGEAANEIESARRKDADQRAKSGKVEGRLRRLHQERLEDISLSLRSPLTSIKRFSSTKERRDIEWDQEIHQEFLQIIDRESDRLDRVVSDLLSPTQRDVNVGVITLGKEPCDIDDLFQKAGAKCDLDLGRKSVAFYGEPTLPRVLVDPARMAQVIYYLAAELEETTTGGQSVTVDARWRQRRPSISIGLLDGEGITAGPIPHRKDESLRLEICRALLSAHGERLEIVTHGRGKARFRFFLPPATE